MVLLQIISLHLFLSVLLPPAVFATFLSNPFPYVCGVCKNLIFTKDFTRFGNITYSRKEGEIAGTLYFDPRTCEKKYCARNALVGSDRIPKVRLAAPGEHSEDDDLDVRVVKALGPRGYTTIRVTVVSHNASSDTIDGRAFDFAEPFRYTWRNFSYFTKLLHNVTEGGVTEFQVPVVRKNLPRLAGDVRLRGGPPSSVEVDEEDLDPSASAGPRNKTVRFFLPKHGAGVVGLLAGDPCVAVDPDVVPVLCDCGRGTDWKLSERFPALLNAFVGADKNMHYWGLLGDNFYDRDGEITDSVYNGRLAGRKIISGQKLSVDTKSKLFLSVLGNHDYWAAGAPVRSTTEDQCGSGFVQFYGIDTVSGRSAGVGESPWDLSVDPRTPLPYRMPDGTWRDVCSPVARSNTFFWHVVGNVGFIGYSSAYSWESQKQDFEEACAALWDDESVDLLMLVGHWNKQVGAMLIVWNEQAGAMLIGSVLEKEEVDRCSTRDEEEYSSNNSWMGTGVVRGTNSNTQ